MFADLDLALQRGDRLALVGRNGSGKSTLLRVMADLIDPDQGTRTVPAGVSVAYLDQDPDLSGFSTLGDFAAAPLAPGEAWRCDALAQDLNLDLSLPSHAASGGESRRAALIQLLAQEPDLALLDEPTNHLDIDAIAWLEARLKAMRMSLVTISHDRAFLTAVTRGTLWIDRGMVRRSHRGFADFEAWRDATWAEEDLARHKLDRKIAAEARWAVEGISARRKRNMGRVRALGDLRATRAAMVRRQDAAALALDAGSQSGRKVIEAERISKSFGELCVLRPFSLRVMRGDRLAILGPNGAGKTTLVNMLTGAMTPDSGSVTLGTNLEIAVFDQTRAALDPEQTLWEALTRDPALAAEGRSDQVLVRGAPRHVIGYLKDFLFDETQARARVLTLSGGERARLLLARIMARQSNLLVLDEPTNDLDVETLDLLQDILGTYEGSVILVSHDRDFVDRVATDTVWLAPGGRATRYAGGWTDMVAQRDLAVVEAKDKTPPRAKRADAPRAKAPTSKLTFTEAHRLKELPAVIDKMVAEIAKLEALLGDAQLYARDPETFQKASAALVDRQATLRAAEEEWLTLAEREEG
ncbi:MAG: ATP-binding cassette domain-containing protein [Pseudomonadota bacterium]